MISEKRLNELIEEEGVVYKKSGEKIQLDDTYSILINEWPVPEQMLVLVQFGEFCISRLKDLYEEV